MDFILLLISILFVVSKVLFLGSYPYFYDSPEYIKESLSSNFLTSVNQMHAPIHPLYLFFIQLAQHYLPGAPIRSISSISFIFGLIGFIAFYLFIKLIYNRKIAFFASIPLLFFPQTFLMQTQVLHDQVEQSVFMVSLLFFAFFIHYKSKLWFVLSILFASLSILNYLGMILWLPIFIFYSLAKSKNKDCKKNISLAIIIALFGILLAIAEYYLIFKLSRNSPLLDMKLLLSGSGQAAFLLDLLSPLGLLRALRNGIYIIFYGYSPFLFLTSVFLFYSLYKSKQWKLGLFLMIWFLSYFISISFWHAGLYGRIGGLIAYPLALSLALIPNKYVYIFILSSIVVGWIFTVISYQQIPIPIIQNQMIHKAKINSNDLLVLSDYQRPQLQGYYSNAVFISSGTYYLVKQEINRAIQAHQKIYISSQAITFPYWQYDGQTIHFLSKGTNNKAQLAPLLMDKKLHMTISYPQYPLLTIYQVL